MNQFWWQILAAQFFMVLYAIANDLQVNSRKTLQGQSNKHVCVVSSSYSLWNLWHEQLRQIGRPVWVEQLNNKGCNPAQKNYRSLSYLKGSNKGLETQSERTPCTRCTCRCLQRWELRWWRNTSL